MHFIQQQQKYNVFTWVDISIIYVPKKMEFVASYLEITCVYYILLSMAYWLVCQSLPWFVCYLSIVK